MCREQAITEWSWHVNSVVACCHSAKLCAYAARDFRSQYYFIPFFLQQRTTFPAATVRHATIDCCLATVAMIIRVLCDIFCSSIRCLDKGMMVWWMWSMQCFCICISGFVLFCFFSAPMRPERFRLCLSFDNCPSDHSSSATPHSSSSNIWPASSATNPIRVKAHVAKLLFYLIARPTCL